MGQTQDYDISVKVKCQFWIFDRVVLGWGRLTGLGAAAAIALPCIALPFEKGGADRKLCLQLL